MQSLEQTEEVVKEKDDMRAAHHLYHEAPGADPEATHCFSLEVVVPGESISATEDASHEHAVCVQDALTWLDTATVNVRALPPFQQQFQKR